MSIREISAVVFDLDGLLVDSEPLQAWAWDTYAQQFGTSLRDDVLERMLGLRAVDAAQIFVDLLRLPVPADVAMRERDELFLEAARGQIDARRGASALLEALREQGVPLALATSGHRRYVDLALASAGLSGVFDVEATGDQVDRGKPHPDIYLRAASMLGVPPERCLALEDAPNGVRSAREAGMLCFAIPEAGSPNGVEDADEILGSLGQVLSMLEPPAPYRLAASARPGQP